MKQHALLAPSSAKRWLTCTPSARLEAQFPDNAGPAAEEGTLAHRLGELLIKQALGLVTKKEFTKELKAIKEVVSSQVQPRDVDDIAIPPQKLYSQEMLGNCEEYCAYVMEKYAEAQVRTKGAVIFVEEHLDLTSYVPEGEGTGDIVIIADGILDMIDLKYGKGVPVSCENNEQLMMYALGAIDRYGLLFDIREVRLNIFQPRIDNISSWIISVENLMKWTSDVLIPRAKIAFAGEGEFVPGEHCRFCRVKATCRANAEQQMQLAVHEFKDPPLLTDEEIVDILAKLPGFTSWAKAVTVHTLHEALHNDKQWPGYKLVEGRSVRKYTEEEKLTAMLEEKGFDRLEFTKTKLVNMKEMTGYLKKKTFDELVVPFLYKPPGKPTLVPASDKREAINNLESARAAFDDSEDLED